MTSSSSVPPGDGVITVSASGRAGSACGSGSSGGGVSLDEPPQPTTNDEPKGIMIAIARE